MANMQSKSAIILAKTWETLQLLRELNSYSAIKKRNGRLEMKATDGEEAIGPLIILYIYYIFTIDYNSLLIHLLLIIYLFMWLCLE